MRSISCLSNEEVIEIAETSKSVETQLQCPQDMEWAIDSDLPFPDSLFWLQTRPAKLQATKPVSATERIIDLIVKRL